MVFGVDEQELLATRSVIAATESKGVRMRRLIHRVH
jgi:hypothetical protein